jgi:hypothetical protein
MCHEATVRHRGAVVVRLLLLLLRCCCCCRCCASRDNGIVRIQYMYCSTVQLIVPGMPSQCFFISPKMPSLPMPVSTVLYSYNNAAACESDKAV